MASVLRYGNIININLYVCIVYYTHTLYPPKFTSCNNIPFCMNNLCLIKENYIQKVMLCICCIFTLENTSILYVIQIDVLT